MADALDIPGFAKKIRSKYPGAYDQLSDADLATKVLNMHPQYAAALDSSKPEIRQFIGGMNNPSLGDMTKRVAQEGSLGLMTGFGLPETQTPWGTVQQAYTALANKFDTGNVVQDTKNQILAPFSAANAIGEGLARNQSGILQSIGQNVQAKQYGQAALRLPGLFNPIIGPAENAAVTAGVKGDLPALANAGGNIAGQTLATLAGTPEGAAATDATIGRIGQGVNSILPGTPLSPAQLIRRAIRPSISKGAALDSAVQSELPRLLNIMEDADKSTLQGLVDAVDKERNNVWKQSQKLKPDAQQTLDGSDIHQAILDSISKRDKVINIRDAQNVQDMAEGYLEKDAQGKVIGGKQIPISDAEDFLKTVHAELDGYYNSNPFQRATKLRSNSEVAALKAEADALRSGIHSNLANPELRQTYGNLATIQEQAERRLQQVNNAAINDMPDRGTKIWATVKGLRGLATANPEAIMEGATGLAANQMLKTANMPDALIRRAVQPGIFGSNMPSGIAGPAIAANALAPKAPPVNYRWDDEAGQLVPVAPLQFSY